MKEDPFNALELTEKVRHCHRCLYPQCKEAETGGPQELAGQWAWLNWETRFRETV